MPKQQGQEINAAHLHPPSPPYSAQPRTEDCANLLVAPFEHTFVLTTRF